MSTSLRIAQRAPRRSGAPAWKLAAGALAVWGTAQCAPPPANEVTAPESAFRAFREALQRADREAAWSFLGPRTQAALQARLEEANRAGLAIASPADLLVVSYVPRAVDLQRIERAEQNDEHVVLRVTSAHGIEADVQLWRVPGGWVLELVEDDDAGGAGDGAAGEQG